MKLKNKSIKMELKTKEVLIRMTKTQKDLLSEYSWQNRVSISQVIRDFVDTLKLKNVNIN
tara:strand:+ start:48 stop:227 length:180 start_codon:yes stop_codon:yes gene_type:complete